MGTLFGSSALVIAFTTLNAFNDVTVQIVVRVTVDDGVGLPCEFGRVGGVMRQRYAIRDQSNQYGEPRQRGKA